MPDCSCRRPCHPCRGPRPRLFFSSDKGIVRVAVLAILAVVLDLVSSFHQITVHKDTIPLTALCTPTRLFEWLVMPQGSSAAPGWFVRVINEAIKGQSQGKRLTEMVDKSCPPPLPKHIVVPRRCQNKGHESHLTEKMARFNIVRAIDGCNSNSRTARHNGRAVAMSLFVSHPGKTLKKIPQEKQATERKK